MEYGTTQRGFPADCSRYEPRAKFPRQLVQRRLTELVLELQQLERKKYITSLDKQFKDKECMNFQLDMWTNTESVEREQYACVIMTTVVDPVDTTAACAQLHLWSDILDFTVFPYSEKTGENVKSWFLQVLDRNRIGHRCVN